MHEDQLHRSMHGMCRVQHAPAAEPPRDMGPALIMPVLSVAGMMLPVPATMGGGRPPLASMLTVGP